MDPISVGIIGVGALIFLLLFKMPVAFAMAFVGFIGFSYLSSWDAGLKILAMDFFEQFSNFQMSAIPMFVLMGSFAFAAGIGKRLFDAAYTILGNLRGGLTFATVVASGMFAAICGSTAATAATIGRVVLKEMKRYHYDDSFATGCVASAGTLGILIPPSTIFLVYGIMTEQSIGKLFMAGIIPGIILLLLFLVVVALMVWRNPGIAPAGGATDFKTKRKALSGIIEALILFSLVIGGLFFGWFTPTQAGGIGAAGALVIGLARRQLSWRIFTEATKDGLYISCMIISIITGSIVFGHFMAVTTIPFVLADWIETLPLPPMVIMGVIIFMYFVGGCFMDSMALIVLTVPVIYPVVMRLGFDPIWFGVIIVLIAEMGVVTPPVGVNVYVIKGIAPDIPLEKIFKGILPFLAAMVVNAFIIMAFPRLALILPNLIK
ncbi:MAG: TRAP transporter large permease [Syntrophales bacterium]|jgi:tripartite ATP-independent transporter DctM subunit|nr:TRAP transporter large permease [Syntrophales bacterium]